jgi:hypothetical protein
MQQYVILDFELAVYFKIMFNQLHNQIEQRFMSKLQYHLHFLFLFSFLLFLKKYFRSFNRRKWKTPIYNAVVALLTP